MCIQYDFDVFTLIPMMASWHPDEGINLCLTSSFLPPPLWCSRLNLTFPSLPRLTAPSIQFTQVSSTHKLCQKKQTPQHHSRDETTQPPRRPATGRGPRTECDISYAWGKGKITAETTAAEPRQRHIAQTPGGPSRTVTV